MSFHEYIKALLEKNAGLAKQTRSFAKDVAEAYMSGSSLPLGGAETPTVVGFSPRAIVKYEPLKGKLLSPYVGAGAGGLRYGVHIRRSTETVPSDSAVGTGLEHQSPRGGALVIAKVRGTRKSK